jgi:ATP-dependent Clp protease ATP-binding subunit ClpA
VPPNRAPALNCRGTNGTLDEVFERFTDQARGVLTGAQEEARLLNHSFIGTEHILLGLIREGEGVGAQALQSLGISLEAVREKVEETIGMAGTASSGSPPFTPRAKKVLELSLREALQLNHSYIGTEHILLGLVREGEGVAATVLVSLGADLPRVRQEVITLMSSGQEPQSGRRVNDPVVTRRPSPPPEPSCPRCRGSVSESARFHTIAVRSDTGDADPMSMDVVYCQMCGTTLHMFKAGGSS